MRCESSVFRRNSAGESWSLETPDDRGNRGVNESHETKGSLQEPVNKADLAAGRENDEKKKQKLDSKWEKIEQTVYIFHNELLA
jgi:hypothetical protein